jgi:hypothetical protein
MVALAEQLGHSPSRYLAAFRAVRAELRRVARDTIVLRDPDGRPLGNVTALRERFEIGPHAPTMYLRRGA